MSASQKGGDGNQQIETSHTFPWIYFLTSFNRIIKSVQCGATEKMEPQEKEIIYLCWWKKQKTKDNFLLMVLFLRAMVLLEPSVGCHKYLSTLSTCKGPDSLESSFFWFLVVFLIVFSPQDSVIIIAQSEQKQMKLLLSGQRKVFFYSLLALLWTLLKSSVLWSLFSLRKSGC